MCISAVQNRPDLPRAQARDDILRQTGRHIRDLDHFVAPVSRPVRCEGSPPGCGSQQRWSIMVIILVTYGHLQFSCLVNWYQLVPLLQPRPCKTPIQSKVCDILLQQRVLWEQVKATIISYRKMFIPVQSYLHSSYKALSRQLSSVTAWSRGMAEGKRIHRHVSERRVLPLNDLSFTRNESGPSTGARCHAPTQCQSKSSQPQQKQNLPNARFN